jgi:hypothetical protein
VPPSTCSSAPVSPGGLNRAYGHAPRFPLGLRHRHCHSNLSDSVPRIFPNTIFGGSIGPRLTVHTIESWPCMTPRGPLTSSTVLVPAVGRRERGHRHLRAAVEQPASRKFRVDARVHPAKPPFDLSANRRGLSMAQSSLGLPGRHCSISGMLPDDVVLPPLPYLPRLSYLSIRRKASRVRLLPLSVLLLAA